MSEIEIGFKRLLLLRIDLSRCLEEIERPVGTVSINLTLSEEVGRKEEGAAQFKGKEGTELLFFSINAFCVSQESAIPIPIGIARIESEFYRKNSVYNSLVKD